MQRADDAEHRPFLCADFQATCQKGKGELELFNQFGDVSKDIMFAGGHHFEEGGFGGGDGGAGVLHPPESCFVIDFVSGGYGIGGDKRVEPPVQEVVNRLRNADVGFDTDDDDLLALVFSDYGIDGIVGHAAEGELVVIGCFTENVLYCFGGAAQALGVLFGYDDGYFQKLSGLDHQATAFDDVVDIFNVV